MKGITFKLDVATHARHVRVNGDWTEYRANRHAEKYFKDYYGIDWTPYLTSYPIR